MTTEPQHDPELWAARRERALRWLHTDLKGYPTLSAEEETEETLAADAFGFLKPNPRCSVP